MPGSDAGDNATDSAIRSVTRMGRGSGLLLVLVVLQFGGAANAQLHVEAAQREPLSLPVGPRAPPVSPIAAPSLEKWTWDRIPTSFHGAPRTRFFNDSELERLAKYQIVALEKWYGPCGAKGGYGVPQSGPSCAEGQKSEVVFAKLKETNPNLTAVLYWNTMFNFAFYEVNQRMLDLEARGQRAFLRDERGEVVMLCNDGNAYCNVTTFDWTSPAVRELWIDSVINASHHGVDGLYADHSAQEHIQIGSHAKGQHGIQLCNGGRKAGPWGPSTQKGHTCWNFNQSFADEFNSWHAWGTEFIQDVLSKTTGGPVFCGPLAKMGGTDACSFRAVRNARINKPPGFVIEAKPSSLAGNSSCAPSESCLAAYLAAAEPGVYLHCQYNEGRPDQEKGPFDLLGQTTFPEMDWYLGPPNGSAVETAPGSNVWRRFFGGNATHAATVVEWADDERQRGQISWSGQPPKPPLPPAPPTPPPSPGPVVPAVCGHLQVNTGIGPPDLGNATVVSSAAQCCESCRAMAGCDAWAWHTEQQNMCHFHPADAKPSPHKRGAFSGYLLVH